MRTIVKNAVVLGMAATFLIGCSAEDPAVDSASLEENGGLNHSYDIENEDLVGTWKLVSMVSDEVAVDLDLDGTRNVDILKETECFQQMDFTFDLEGTVVTNQAKLYFRTEKGNMECKSGTYSAEYEVTGNELKIGFVFGGIKVYETRYIDVIEENGNSYLEMTLTYEEAKQYISDLNYQSPTGATDVKAVTMLFKKQ